MFSFMKPEPKRTKVKPATNSDSSSSGASVTTNVSRPVTKPSKPSKPPNPPILNTDGTLPEFPCRVCGRYKSEDSVKDLVGMGRSFQ